MADLVHINETLAVASAIPGWQFWSLLLADVAGGGIIYKAMKERIEGLKEQIDGLKNENVRLRADSSSQEFLSRLDFIKQAYETELTALRSQQDRAAKVKEEEESKTIAQVQEAIKQVNNLRALVEKQEAEKKAAISRLPPAPPSLRGFRSSGKTYSALQDLLAAADEVSKDQEEKRKSRIFGNSDNPG